MEVFGEDRGTPRLSESEVSGNSAQWVLKSDPTALLSQRHGLGGEDLK